MNASALAAWLMRRAVQLMPAARCDWAEAMQAEFEALCSEAGSGARALRWASGCLLTCLMERMRSMNMPTRSPLGLSRWILGAEMLLAFGPLTWLFGVVVMLDLRGRAPGEFSALLISATLLGPAGLLLAARIIALPRVAPGRAARWALPGLAAWTLLVYGAHLGRLPSPDWRALMLIAVLPAIAVAHLCVLGARGERSLRPEIRG